MADVNSFWVQLQHQIEAKHSIAINVICWNNCLQSEIPLNSFSYICDTDGVKI